MFSILDIIIFTIGAYITALLLNRLSIFVASFRKNAQIELVATRTHNDRTLHFVKGHSYTFYKNGNEIMLDTDESGYIDLFRFKKEYVLESFKPIDIYGKYVLQRIQNWKMIEEPMKLVNYFSSKV